MLEILIFRVLIFIFFTIPIISIIVSIIFLIVEYRHYISMKKQNEAISDTFSNKEIEIRKRNVIGIFTLTAILTFIFLVIVIGIIILFFRDIFYG